ncbi:DUF3152 domain-containing protein [Couchioplanes azureus]|uniref:DUF3152 domain-containing protein n=1 Tax=Couchioplanes caeruleus TaxID=56438 RepID=UPI00199CB379|nr:DUF3152 domain-containing protein [Couchioplanes caeruleus]GGQ60633.1 hypothetical protein GCM10010166_32850 [Couchioplanes caeruleus subsp. azureus]
MTRSWSVLAALLLLVLPGLVLIGIAVHSPGTPADRPAVAAPPPAPPAPTRPTPKTDRATRVEKITYPARGRGDWRTAPGSDRTGGKRGTLLRYRVLMESDIKGVSVGTFADAVTAALDDPRGWTAEGTLRLRRVGPGQPYDFTIYLVTPVTRDVLCEDAADGYTSCRNGDKVVLNVARWAKGVPGYGAALPVYRQYLVNHEVGHRLGHDHELCPGAGRPAPVMQQQTLGMHGCAANPWPYRDGKRYAGRPGAYDDAAPGREGDHGA